MYMGTFQMLNDLSSMILVSGLYMTCCNRGFLLSMVFFFTCVAGGDTSFTIGRGVIDNEIHALGL